MCIFVTFVHNVKGEIPYEEVEIEMTGDPVNSESRVSVRHSMRIVGPLCSLRCNLQR